VRLLAALALASCAAALAGCMGGEDTIDVSAAQRLVLQQSDVSAAFTRFDFGRLASADLPGGARSDPSRFGREGGWKARYQRGGTPATSGPLVIESRVDVFESSGGAEDEFAAIRSELDAPPDPVMTPTTRLADPDVGDEALAWSAVVPARPRNTVFFTVAWRHRNVTASISVNGFEGRLELEEAIALAREQQRRIEAAA
jgi:hypothetical protein